MCTEDIMSVNERVLLLIVFLKPVDLVIFPTTPGLGLGAVPVLLPQSQGHESREQSAM